jgi:hypothetical protein
VFVELRIVVRIMSRLGVSARFEQNVPYKCAQLIITRDFFGFRDASARSGQAVPSAVALPRMHAVAVGAGERLIKPLEGREQI